MVKKLYLIGMGPGDIKYLTLEAVETIRKLKLFLIPVKIGKKAALTLKRKEILLQIKANEDFRVLEIYFPERKKTGIYEEEVKRWREKKAQILKEVLEREMEREAGFLVWGDPSLYDGHLEIFKELQKELGFSLEVVPGISAFQILSAKHQISLTEIAGTLIFTTPRGLKKLGQIEHRVIVFLDNYETYKNFASQNLEIYWGAYLGTPEEVLLSGELKEVLSQIVELRRKLRKDKGFIMETYLLSPILNSGALSYEE